MTKQEEQARIDAEQEKLKKQQEELEEHRLPCGEEDNIAIDTVAVADKNHKLEVIRDTEASINIENGSSIKAYPGGLEKPERNDGTR